MLEQLRSHLPSKKDILNKTTAFVLTGVITSGAVGGFIGYRLRGYVEPLTSPTNSSTEAKVDLSGLLNSILKATPHTKERRSLEFKYLVEVLENPTLSKIDRGLWMTSDPDIRIYLLNERYALRQKGLEGLKPISDDRLQWIKDQGIHPETLGIAYDNYSKALEIAQQLINKGVLRDDKLDDEKKITADETLINPGGMAQLIAFETGGTKKFIKGGSAYGFSNIGEGLSINEINDSRDAFPNAKSALKELCELTSINTGLNFVPENIPGSLRGNPNFNLSGGAISIQFMPDRALSIYKLVKEKAVDKRTGKPILLNIFDVGDATVMGYIFLARHEITSDGIRYGYWKGHPSDIKAALVKWNPFSFQIETIYNAAVDYYSKFIDGKPQGTY